MNIGEKMKWLRIKNNLTQEELANRCELSKGYISQLERDLTSPSIATLMDLLDCLGTNLKDFFSDNTPETVVFSQDDIFSKQNEELGHEVNWLITTAQNNLMEPITITLQPGGQSENHDPHEGEEFGYVLKGRIQLQLGLKTFRVKQGESFYFKSSVPHLIRNSSKTEARVLWVSTPPTF